MAAPCIQAEPEKTAAAQRGRITLIVGCMFSGKTTELLRRAREHGDDQVLLFKHWLEARYATDAIVSHGRRRHAAVVVQDGRDILRSDWRTKKLIGVDEAHFFSGVLVEVARTLRDAGVNLVVTALDRDSWGRPFSVVERLRAVAQSVQERTALCAQCGALADRTQRITRIIDHSMVGGPESYEPRCLECWRPPPETPVDPQ